MCTPCKNILTRLDQAEGSAHEGAGDEDLDLTAMERGSPGPLAGERAARGPGREAGETTALENPAGGQRTMRRRKIRNGSVKELRNH